MTSFNLVEVFVKVFEDLFSYIGINHKFMCEVPESSLNSTQEVNTLVGVLGDIEGNMSFGFSELTEKEIAAKIIGKSANDINNIDLFVKAAIADFFSDFAKRVISMIKAENIFYNGDDGVKNYTILSSSPTYIAGNELFGMISQENAKKLFFKVNDEKFDIAFSLREK